MPNDVEGSAHLVATDEILSESMLPGQRRRQRCRAAGILPARRRYGTSISSAASVVKFTDHGTLIADQKFETQFGSSDDLFIIHYSLAIERSARNRNYSPSLGRWINQDPAGYVNGANTYQFVMGNPVGNVDPSGLDAAGTALGQYLYWQYHTQQLVNQFQNRKYQGQQLGLLKGIAAASLPEELKAENQFYNLKHESPLQALGDLREHLEKAAKIGKHVPYAKPLADVLERLGVLISVVKAERGLASNTGPGQLKGLGNALLALGALMPPELGGPLVSSAGQYLSNAANAVAYLDQQVGAQNYNSWIGGKGSGSHDGSDIPFSPQWANTVLSENGQGLPSFSQAYQNFENNGQGYCYH